MAFPTEGVSREISVLAWGLGIDRIAMFKLGINDIRELFSHNLEFLRNKIHYLAFKFTYY